MLKVILPFKKIQIFLSCTLLLLFFITGNAQQIGQFKVVKENEVYKPSIFLNGASVLQTPHGGLWGIATAWQKDWPANWQYAHATKLVEENDWSILYGELQLPQGKWKLRDAYTIENGLVKCVRRFEWVSNKVLDSVTLSVQWKVIGNELQAFLPGILYYGNPSGSKHTPENVPSYKGEEGELAIFEEHRYAMPFVTLEQRNGTLFGATLHTLPSPVKNPRLIDQWWSMGVTGGASSSNLLLLSGPVGYNKQYSVAKALQGRPMKYDNTYIAIRPGTVIEKTFYLDVHAITQKGSAFQRPVHQSLQLFEPFFLNGLPSFDDIVRNKYKYAFNRYIDEGAIQGFNMYPSQYQSEHIVMGWCGQAAANGYAFQQLKKYSNNTKRADEMIQQSLDFLTSSPIDERGFSVLFDVKKKTWNPNNKDHVSMGQGMYNFAKAIESARRNKQYSTKKWEEFLIKTADFAAKRILSPDWKPFSTAEGFYIAPLVLAHKLFKKDSYKSAAIKAGEHYAQRHLSMDEPYWGGTLDATGEDKEGAWACFQGFITLYEHYRNDKYLKWAKHAGDVCLSYTVAWDIPLPPGRLSDHALKTRGWTVVSPQNQHIDVYGVLYAPEIYKLGQYTKDDNLKQLSKVMFRTCGQLMDPYGSQGEQLQQTNFAQHGDMSDVYRLRGGYSESWNVFWITTHFLHAAARFEEMGVTP